MDIFQNNTTITITKDDLYIVYTLDFQSQWFRLDSIVTGHTSIFTDDNWWITDNKIGTENDFNSHLWKYPVPSDTITIKFKGIHEENEAISTQKFKKFTD